MNMSGLIKAADLEPEDVISCYVHDGISGCSTDLCREQHQPLSSIQEGENLYI